MDGTLEGFGDLQQAESRYCDVFQYGNISTDVMEKRGGNKEAGFAWLSVILTVHP